MLSKEKDDKYHVRTLEEVDKHGRILSTRITYDLDSMLRDAFPELQEEEPKKKEGKLIPFAPK